MFSVIVNFIINNTVCTLIHIIDTQNKKHGYVYVESYSKNIWKYLLNMALISVVLCCKKTYKYKCIVTNCWCFIRVFYFFFFLQQWVIMIHHTWVTLYKYAYIKLHRNWTHANCCFQNNKQNYVYITQLLTWI